MELRRRGLQRKNAALVDHLTEIAAPLLADLD